MMPRFRIVTVPAAVASRDAIARAFAAELPVTIMRGKCIVRISPDGSEKQVGNEVK